MQVDRNRIRSAWQGRISGCRLGKPLELLSILKGRDAVREYLERNGAWPLRDYVPAGDEFLVTFLGTGSCKGSMARSEPDDDINYTVLALMMLEDHGAEITTHHVAHAWLKYLPAGQTFTAEKAAYKKLLDLVDDTAFVGISPDIDLGPCSDNEYNDYIGAQIRADMYGWVCPGDPALAAELARRDASLSHRGEGVYGAMFVAALGAAIPLSESMGKAVETALELIPPDSECAGAVRFGMSVAENPDAVDALHDKYEHLHPVHTVNNLAVVVWGLLNGAYDFSVAIGDTVAAGWDTDCNGATVGGLWGLTGGAITAKWTDPWRGRVAVTIAGVGELLLDDLVDRTVAVAEKMSG